MEQKEPYVSVIWMALSGSYLLLCFLFQVMLWCCVTWHLLLWAYTWRTGHLTLRSWEHIIDNYILYTVMMSIFQVAVCNLASIALNMYVRDRTFDFEKLRSVTKVIVRNLNKIIEVNFYPVPEVSNSFRRENKHLETSYITCHLSCWGCASFGSLFVLGQNCFQLPTSFDFRWCTIIALTWGRPLLILGQNFKVEFWN